MGSITPSDDELKSPLLENSTLFWSFDQGLEAPLPINNNNPSDHPIEPTIEDPNEIVPLLCFRVRRSIKNEVIVFVLMIIVIATGTGNSVAGRIKGQAMGRFNFFASLGNSIIYVFLYFGILFTRYFIGLTPKSDLVYPWTLSSTVKETQKSKKQNKLSRMWRKIPPFKFFLLMGLLDGLANILGLIAQPYISGQIASIMTQAIVGFSMLCAIVVLGTRYTYWQVWGAAVILGGTTICLFANGTDDSKNHFGFAILQLVSSFPNALSFTFKELIFVDRKKLDIFVVNSHGGIPFGKYMLDGLKCFVGKFPADKTSNCASMPWPFLIYIAFNLAFNVSLLILLKRASALQGFMAIKAILPFSFIAYYFKWPLIGSSSLNGYIIAGLVVVCSGLVVYRIATISKETHKSNKYYSGCFATALSFTPEPTNPTNIQGDKPSYAKNS